MSLSQVIVMLINENWIETIRLIFFTPLFPDVEVDGLGLAAYAESHQRPFSQRVLTTIYWLAGGLRCFGPGFVWWPQNLVRAEIQACHQVYPIEQELCDFRFRSQASWQNEQLKTVSPYYKEISSSFLPLRIGIKAQFICAEFCLNWGICLLSIPLSPAVSGGDLDCLYLRFLVPLLLSWIYSIQTFYFLHSKQAILIMTPTPSPLEKAEVRSQLWF